MFEGQPSKIRPFSNQNKGHLGSRYIYTYIYISIYPQESGFKVECVNLRDWQKKSEHPSKVVTEAKANKGNEIVQEVQLQVNAGGVKFAGKFAPKNDSSNPSSKS